MTDAYDYEGPRGSACMHLAIGNNRVLCGYNCVNPPAGELHEMTDKIEHVTCSMCRLDFNTENRK
jgi:hypothetical protein